MTDTTEKPEEPLALTNGLKLSHGWAMPSKDADALTWRCQRAESALEDSRAALETFKVEVRDAVISEAEANDWCDRTDGWLEQLGLEPRKPRWSYDGCTRKGTIISLDDGDRAILCDSDDLPWRVFTSYDDSTTDWIGFEEVAKIGFEVILDGKGEEVEYDNR